MKKNLKKTLAKATALAMALAMTVSVVPASSADAKAKKPKLAKKSVTVTVKQTKKVKIKNTKKIKKTKWSVDKKGKKFVKLSKKKKTYVKVKGQKVGTATVTAKVTLKGKKKATKLKLKVTVKKATTPTKKPSTKPNTPKPTTKPTTKPQNTPTPVPTPDKIGGVDVDTKETVHIPVTMLNETSITCDEKRAEDYQDNGHVGAEVTKKGFTFTTKEAYNSMAMFYLDPVTSEADLMDAPEGANWNGRVLKVPVAEKGKKIDIGDYDYIRVTLKDTPRETNLRLYNDLDQFLVDGAGLVGTQFDFYGLDSVGRGDYVKKEPVEAGSSNTANAYYDKNGKELGDGYSILAVKDAVKKAKTSEFIAIAVGGQFKGQEITIADIELLKVKDSVPATDPASVVISAEDGKKAILQGATLQLSAEVLNKNGVKIEDTVTWSVAGDAATISEEGLLTAADDKTGEVTVTAASVKNPEVKDTYKVKIADEASVMSLAFTNKYTTYTTEETKDGVEIAAKALNGAGEPVSDQPEITVTSKDATSGITYEDGKVKGTVAGSITLTATYDVFNAEVTITVVDGKRIELTESNTGWVENYQSGDTSAGGSKSSVSDGVLTYTSGNWNGGAAIKVDTGDKTIANIAGLMYTYQNDDSSNNDNAQMVVIRYGDPTQRSQTATGQGGAETVLYKTDENPYTKEQYKEGVEIKATFDWNFLYGDDGRDVTVDTSGTEIWFTVGKNGPSAQVHNISNVIVLWGQKQEMPALKSVEISEGTGQTTVPKNRTMQLKATAVYANNKTKTVTDTAEWKSSDDETATVSKGLVTPVKEGTVEITAKVDTITSAAYSITVEQDKVVEPVTLTYATPISDPDHGKVAFSDCTGYVADTFNVTDFAKVTYKVKAYKTGDELITSTGDLDNTKVCVNCSSDGSRYNYGYGDGFGKNMLKDGSMGEEGVITLTCSKLSDGPSVADCLSYQLDGGTVTKLEIIEIKFE
ncbi:MAG: Ig-like domain-containing protein [Lachnospiraceae bacterium]|nr:Ig-like domain-containing protein [Lachnospiraceae bacterium]